MFTLTDQTCSPALGQPVRQASALVRAGGHVSASLSCVCCILQDETTPYSFFIDDVEISGSLSETLSEAKSGQSSSEVVVQITYQAQSVFHVRAVTRCTSTIEGHAEAVLTLQFSPNGR